MTTTRPTGILGGGILGPGILGAGIDRVDGPLKVAGAAPYAMDISAPGMAHLAVVRSTIAAGRVRDIDVSRADAMPGVVAVITPRNALRVATGPVVNNGPTPLPPLQSDEITYNGQYVAAVVAETAHEAAAAARAVEVSYETVTAAILVDDPRGELVADPYRTDTERGDVATALATADVVHEATYSTADNTNNPLGLFATVAMWDGDDLTVYDTTQWTSNVSATLAQMFGLQRGAVRVYAKYVGGGFGSGLRVWPHVPLTVLAARMVGRPVKLVLSRPEMFTGVGHRPSTVQRIRLGARRDGGLVALRHESVQSQATSDEHREMVASSSSDAYACPNGAFRDQQRRLNIPGPGSMRAPGVAPGNFALESALDELAYALGMDPLELRLRNDAEVHPSSGLPWSSRAMRECLLVGAERFGWSNRDPRIGSMRDGTWLVGYGLAGATYPWWQQPCAARATLYRDGTAYVRSAANDIGTGTYTVMRQLSAQLLGLELDRVRFDLGDSQMPPSPQAGGSGLTGALGNAIAESCHALVARFLALLADDPTSPLRGATVADVVASGGRIHRVDDPSASESYSAVLDRHGLDSLAADGVSEPVDAKQAGMARAGAFGAKFVEVRVDADLGIVRVPRVVQVIDGGRILNEKLARSQIIGGTVGGIGHALLEETITDDGTGRIANATFSDYLVPVNADVGDIDVVFVGEPDRLTPIGTKGVGEIGLVGIAAAIANGIYHATGIRIRDLPISIDKILMETGRWGYPPG